VLTFSASEGGQGAVIGCMDLPRVAIALLIFNFRLGQVGGDRSTIVHLFFNPFSPFSNFVRHSRLFPIPSFLVKYISLRLSFSPSSVGIPVFLAFHIYFP